MFEDDGGLLASSQLVGNDQPIQGIIHRGQVALARLEQNQTWPDWCAVIKALAKGRDIRRQTSGGHNKGRRFNEAMGSWLRRYGFDRIHKSDRSRLLRCADHLEAIDSWRSGRPLSEQLELNHPRIVFERWQRILEKDEDTPTPSVNQNPKNPSGFTDAEWTDALRTNLGFERFLRVMPNEWRPKLELRAASWRADLQPRQGPPPQHQTQKLQDSRRHRGIPQPTVDRGFAPRSGQADYIAGWIDLLNSDPTTIFTCAWMASAPLGAARTSRGGGVMRHA
jgi:hypothetical protein